MSPAVSGCYAALLDRVCAGISWCTCLRCASQALASCGSVSEGLQGRVSAGAGAQDLASEPSKQGQAMQGGLAPQIAQQAVPGPGFQHMPLPAAVPAAAPAAPPLTASTMPGPQVLLKPSFFEASSQELAQGQELEGMGQQQLHFQSQSSSHPSAPPPPLPIHAAAGNTTEQAPGTLGSLLQPVAALSLGPTGDLAGAAPVQSPHVAAPNAASHFLSSILLRGDVSTPAPAVPLGPSAPAHGSGPVLSQNGVYTQKHYDSHLVTQEQQQQQVAPTGVPKVLSESSGAAQSLLPASHGAPLLQPFPPPVPPASLTHPSLPRPHSLGSNSVLTISRDGLKRVLLKLVQVGAGVSGLPCTSESVRTNFLLRIGMFQHAHFVRLLFLLPFTSLSVSWAHTCAFCRTTDLWTYYSKSCRDKRADPDRWPVLSFSSIGKVPSHKLCL